jgi:hypothetical protein
MSNDPRFIRSFDPYKEDRDKKAAETCAWRKNQAKILAKVLADDKIKTRQINHMVLTKRSKKIPVTLPKIGRPKDE